MYWDGQQGSGSIVLSHTVAASEVGLDQAITVDVSVVEANMDQEITLYYKVARVLGGSQISPASKYKIVQNRSRWRSTTEMLFKRAFHCSILMENNELFVVGGSDSDSETKEFFNFTTEQWIDKGETWGADEAQNSAIASHKNGLVVFGGGSDKNSGFTYGMNWLRAINTNGEFINFPAWITVEQFTRHTLSTLQSGGILLAGGLSDNGQPYEYTYIIPASFWETINDIPLLENMKTLRYDHTASTLNNGKVLVAGGTTKYGTTTNSTEIFDEKVKSWSNTNSLNFARAFHTSTVLESGKVLVVAGRENNSEALSSVELYDPNSGQWTLTGSLAQARFGHTATLLSLDRVLVAGGRDSAGNSLSSVELYDPTSGTWSAMPDMLEARAYHIAQRSPSGLVLVAGGLDSNENRLATAELFEYSPD